MAAAVPGHAAPAKATNGRLLAFDTSTESMAVAVQSAAGLFTWNGPGGALASSQLLPRVDALLRQAGIQLGQLHAIAFGRGPGAFTGLRTACAVAQGLALGASLPVLAVDSLLIVAEDARSVDAAMVDVQVAMDARMGEIYAGRYAWDGRRWSVRRAPALCTPHELSAACDLDAPACAAGSALPVFGAQLHLGRATLVEQPHDRAAALMRLAQQAWRDGEAVDAALALPVYLRDKVALTVDERQGLPAARGVV